MDGRTAAATLGVGPRATRDEIRLAFRAKAKLAHPDAGPAGSMERFIALRQAADRLLRDAPDETPPPRRGPAVARFDERFRGPATSIDLRDSERRPPGAARPSGRSAVTRDARGLSFADHLAAALARP